MSEQILFLCPHNAAKSVMAAEYFNKRSRDLGLRTRAVSAGTQPDEATAPKVVSLLKAEGFYEKPQQPRKVTVDDMRSSSLVVSIGCDLKDLPTSDAQILQWDEVPMPSQNLAEAWRTIKDKVDDLIDTLQE